MPSILDYAGYVDYLRDAYAARKSRDRNFSHRFIQRRTGVRTSGWFADVISGRRKLKTRDVAGLAAAFRMDPRERDFLKAMVDGERADSPEEKASALDRRLELKGLKGEVLAREKLRYFERWYYSAIRELLGITPKPWDPVKLAAALQPPVPVRKVREALALLTQLGLTAADSGSPSPVLTMDTSAAAAQWHKLWDAYIELAHGARKSLPKQERDFSAVTLTFSPDGFEQACEEAALFRRKLLALSRRGKGNDRVYQGLFQIFPVTSAARSENA